MISPRMLTLASVIIFGAAIAGCERSNSPGTPAFGQESRAASDDIVRQTTRQRGTQEDTDEVKRDAVKSSGNGSVKPAPPTAAIKDYSFDDLKFEMEKTDPFERSMLTPKIEALAGQPIRIRGYILPSFQQTGLTQFVLVRDNMECCFGPGAALYDCILVEMDEGKSADFSIRPVAVEGIFSIDEMIGPDGKHLAIYHLQAGKVE